MLKIKLKVRGYDFFKLLHSSSKYCNVKDFRTNLVFLRHGFDQDGVLGLLGAIQIKRILGEEVRKSVSLELFWSLKIFKLIEVKKTCFFERARFKNTFFLVLFTIQSKKKSLKYIFNVKCQYGSETYIYRSGAYYFNASLRVDNSWKVSHE